MQNKGTLNFDLYCALGQMCTCQAKNEIAKNTFEIAPYLYPFTIEFRELLNGKLSFYVLSRHHFITQ